MSEVKLIRLIPYNGTDAALTAFNPIPRQSELVIVKPTVGTAYRLKIGDGVSHYVTLPFFTGSGGGPPQSLQDTLDIGYTAVNGGGHNGLIILTDAASNNATVQPGSVGAASATLQTVLVPAGLDFKKLGFPNHVFLNFPPAPAANRTINIQDGSGTLAFLSDIVSAGNLQGVLNAGNTAVNGGGNVGTIILLDLAATPNKTTIDQTGIAIKQGLIDYAGLNNPGSGGGNLYLKDQVSNRLCFVSVLGLTAARTVLLPDEGGGAGVDDTLVIHRTKDPIYVDIGGGKMATVAHNIVKVEDTGNFASFGYNVVSVINAADGLGMFANSFSYNNIASAFNTQLVFVAPTANRTIQIPDESGSLCMKLTYALAIDANYVVSKNYLFVELPVTTAPRNIVMPAATAGAVVVVANLSGNAGDWTFTGVAVKTAAGLAVGALNVTVTYNLIGNGVNWRII